MNSAFASYEASISYEVQTEALNQRYAASLTSLLKQHEIKHTQTPEQDHQSDNPIMISMQVNQNIKSNQNQYFYIFLKKTFEIWKFLNPQINFQKFLELFLTQLNQKIEKYRIDTNKKYCLNILLMQNELKILKSSLTSTFQHKQKQFLALQKQSQKLNQQYTQLIEELVEKNQSLNTENIRLQLQLKTNEIKQKQRRMKSFYCDFNKKDSNQKNNSKSTHFYQCQSSIPNQKKQELNRIKTVIKNNMWGWGEQITQRLSKLKALEAELNPK